jgi:hypothetical protein
MCLLQATTRVLDILVCAELMASPLGRHFTLWRGENNAKNSGTISDNMATTQADLKTYRVQPLIGFARYSWLKVS